jgi:excisionase family DNA binding protein
MVSRQTATLALGAMRAVWRIGNEQAGRVPPAALQRWQTAFAELAAVRDAADGIGLVAAGPPVGPFEVISTKTAAQRLNIAERTVRKRLAEGRLPGRRVGRQWVVEWRRDAA